MSDGPILFSGSMVCANLAGLKTETRRIVKPQPEERLWAIWKRFPEQKNIARWAPGDRLYVREHHWSWGQWEREGFTKSGRPRYRFRHQGQCIVFERPANDAPMAYFDGGVGWAYHVGIHMPRWASRTTIIVKAVRVERLHEIDEVGAKAEGIRRFDSGFHWEPNPEPGISRIVGRTPVLAYVDLWEDINGPGSWDVNPWVSVTTYIVEQRNIDAPRDEMVAA